MVENDAPNSNKDSVVSKTKVKIPLPFSQRLNKKHDELKLRSFLRSYQVIDKYSTAQSPIRVLGYAKFMKYLVINTKVMDFKTTEVTKNCSTVMTSQIVVNQEDPSIHYFMHYRNLQI